MGYRKICHYISMDCGFDIYAIELLNFIVSSRGYYDDENHDHS
jgi:hypothetical protein